MIDMKKLICKIFGHNYEQIAINAVKCKRCKEESAVKIYYIHERSSIKCSNCGKVFTQETIEGIVDHEC
jgi:transposase-like protein